MTGTALVLHGFSGCAAAMADITEPLAEHLDVVAVDLAGHGTDSAVDDHGCTVDGMASAVADRIEAIAAAGAGPCHLIGYSLGGRVALTAAVRRPELIGSLSVLSASPGLADPEARRARAELDDRRALELVADPQRFFDDWLNAPLFAGLKRLGERWRAESLAQRLANDPAAMARVLRLASPGRMRYLSPELLGRVTVPTAVIAGADDSAYCRIGAGLAESLPCARLTVVPGAGHAVHAEAPEAVVAAILDVIAAADRQPQPEPQRRREARDKRTEARPDGEQQSR